MDTIDFNDADHRVQCGLRVLLETLGDPASDPEGFAAAAIAHRQAILELAAECRKTPPWQQRGVAMAPALTAQFCRDWPVAPYVAGFRYIAEHSAKEAAGLAPPNAGNFAARIALPVIAELLPTVH